MVALASLTLRELHAMLKEIDKPIAQPVARTFTITTKDKEAFVVDSDLIKRSAKLSEQSKAGQEITLPKTKSKNLAVLLKLAERSPQVDPIRNLTLYRLLEVLRAEASLDFDKKLVKEPLFQAIAADLTWSEQDLAKVLEIPDTELPRSYKEAIIKAFIQNPSNQKTMTKGQERPWKADDLDVLITFEDAMSLSENSLTLIFKELIEAREGLLEAIVGFRNVHNYRCRTNPEIAEKCARTGFLFAEHPLIEDIQLLNDIKKHYPDEYKAVQKQLIEKYK